MFAGKASGSKQEEMEMVYGQYSVLQKKRINGKLLVMKNKLLKKHLDLECRMTAANGADAH